MFLVQLDVVMVLVASKKFLQFVIGQGVIFIIIHRSYKSSDIKQACDGADVAIACLGTGIDIIAKN